MQMSANDRIFPDAFKALSDAFKTLSDAFKSFFRSV